MPVTRAQHSTAPEVSTRGERRYPPLVTAVVIAAILTCYAAVFWTNRALLLAGASDFSSFYAAGSIVAAHRGPQVYDLEIQKEAQAEFIRKVSFHQGANPFNHLAFELLIYAPLSYLPFAQAEVLWYAVNIGVLLLVAFLLRRQFAFARRRFPWVLLGLALFYPVVIALVQGQDSLLLLLVFTLMWAALSAGRSYGAGGLLALATIKPQLVLPFLLALLVAKQWRVLLGFLAASVPLTAISVALVGWRAVVIGYPRFLLAFSRLSPEIAAAYPERMPNIRGLIYAAAHARLSPGSLQMLVLLSSALLLLSIVALARTERGRFSDLQFAFVLTVSLLTGYHTNIHDDALLALPCLLVLDRMVAARAATATSRSMYRALVLAIGAMFVVPLLSLPAQVLCLAILSFAAAVFLAAMRHSESTAAEAMESPPL